MNILAIDTSGGVCTTAVLADNRLLSEVYMDGRRTHSETLGVMVDQCLKYAELTAEDINLFACAVGPGSFTGLRIGVGFIKGWRMYRSGPRWALLRWMRSRERGGFDALICPIIDARREESIPRRTKEALLSLLTAVPLKASCRTGRPACAFWATRR